MLRFAGLATQTEVTLDDIKAVGTAMVRFSRYYEREFYQGKWDRYVIQLTDLGRQRLGLTEETSEVQVISLPSSDAPASSRC
ncbi:MAG TPA: hypothetical protein VHV10_11065 [Ktedonobacteraceae bacterium]|jgi:hypothetical protein|nr:hypothetical protein [Ktedonobacteraceae bacterium]